MQRIATFLLLLMAALGAQATPIHYVVSGQFSSDAPTTPVSAPGAVFTFEFTLTYTTPDYVDEEHGWSEYWYVPVTFRLGSETVSGLTDSWITFFDAAHGGMLEVDFFINERYGFFFLNGPQLYTGMLADPTFLLGSFDAQDFGGKYSYGRFYSGLGVNDSVVGGSVLAERGVPEPATVVLMSAAAAVLAVQGVFRRSRRSRAVATLQRPAC
ncbi:MAG TPA: PEP-CTERM sorting domain-containing protein [Bryobacteraceae bacterium]|nr:PEP-CTERM sorting domain-containing protein [Bryobacteraceae bacterium]HOQ43979.1 PEP-CTERM sorting domain-containing protein [Bryobacteraceae bacterium]HPU72957.1 PEP-CTERM sorting domain-containing protein [Bryobacteraceae bacterium]